MFATKFLSTYSEIKQERLLQNKSKRNKSARNSLWSFHLREITFAFNANRQRTTTHVFLFVQCLSGSYLESGFDSTFQLTRLTRQFEQKTAPFFQLVLINNLFIIIYVKKLLSSAWLE